MSMSSAAEKSSGAEKFTPLQLELLNLYAREVPEEQLLEIKQLIANYFAQKATEIMNQALAGKNVDEWVDNTLKEHLRTPYKSR